MFLKKLDISKKQLTVLGLVTLVFIVALVLFITLIGTGINNGYTDLDFLGYQFSAKATEVEITTPEFGQSVVEINDDTLHELEVLSANINDAYDEWTALIRNAMILIYMVFIFILLQKQRETYFQGKFKGFFIGASLIMLLVVAGGIFDIRLLLISFSHHLSHMAF